MGQWSFAMLSADSAISARVRTTRFRRRPAFAHLLGETLERSRLDSRFGAAVALMLQPDGSQDGSLAPCPWIAVRMFCGNLI